MTRQCLDTAEFALTLAARPHEEWADLIDGDARKQEVADHLLAVIDTAPSPGPVQRGIVRAVFRQARNGGGSDAA